MNEQDQFLKDLEGKDDVDAFGEPIVKTEPKVEEQKVEEEEVPEDLKNRRHKRLEAKLQSEREANIALAARLETISEAKKFSSESADAQDHLKSIERIYGTDSPEAVAATELLKSALVGVQKKATEDALAVFRQEQREAAENSRKEEKALDSMLEDIEDEYNVDLTSPKSEELRKGFFKRLQKLSPKDADGNILHFADPHAVWEDFASKLPKKTDTRAKDLASRSMVQSSTADTTKVELSKEEQYLREIGIL